MSDKSHFSRITISKEKTLIEAASLLQKWLDEVVREGLSVLQADTDRIGEIASRMVDKGMPGIARKLRVLPEKIAGDRDWTSFVMAQFGELYLFTRYFENLDTLDELEKEDVLNFCGVVFRKADFSDDQLLTDEWLYLGNSMEKEENLRIKRNWFYGTQSNRLALYLEFQINTFVRLKPFQAGYSYQSPVQFYPSKVAQRIRDIDVSHPVKSQWTKLPVLGWSELLDHYCELVVKNPFVRQQCYFLGQAKLARISDRWFFCSERDELIVIGNTDDQMKTVLLYSGHPGRIFIIEYYQNTALVISILIEGLLVEL